MEIIDFFQEQFESERVVLHSSFSNVYSSYNVSPIDFLNKLHASCIKTLILPTLSWRSAKENYEFRAKETKANTGILCNVAISEGMGTRSIHPTHSILVIGELGSLLDNPHYKSSSQCGKGSPWEKIIGMEDVNICLLNVGLESCTIFHYFEEVLHPNIYLESHYSNYLLPDVNDSCRVRNHKPIKRIYSKVLNDLSNESFKCKIFDQNFIIYFKPERIAKAMKKLLLNNPKYLLA